MQLRFFVGACAILLFLASYCLNPSHEWREGIGALPKDHIEWLPASAYASGAKATLITAVEILFVGLVGIHLKRRQWSVFISVLIGLSAIMALVTIGQRVTPQDYPIFEWTGFFAYENHYAEYANLVLPVALSLGLRGRIRAFNQGALSDASSLYFVAALLIFASIYLSGSRAGLCIASLTVFVSVANYTRLFRRYPQMDSLLSRKLTRILFLTMGVLAVPAVLYALYYVFQVGNEFSFRWTLIVDSLRMWIDYPGWGVGPGAFSAVFPYYQSIENITVTHVHCEWVQFLAEYGVLGCAVLVSVITWMLWAKRSSLEKRYTPCSLAVEGVGASLALGSVALHGLFDFPLRNPVIAGAAVLVATYLIHLIRFPRKKARREN